MGERGAYGRGSVYKTTVRGKTVYRSAKIVSRFDGVRKKVIGTGASASEALARMEANIAKFQGGPAAKPTPKAANKSKPAATSPATASERSFLDIADEWLAWRRAHSLASQKKKQLSEQTANSYRYIIKNHLDPWGAEPIGSYTKKDVEQLAYWDLEALGLSNSHIRAIQGVVYQTFEYAKDRDYIKKDPARDLHLLTRNKEEQFEKVKSEKLDNYSYVPDRVLWFLSPDRTPADFEQKNMVMTAAERWTIHERYRDYEARWALSALLALRPSEVRGLTWDCIKYLDAKPSASSKQLPQVIIRQQLARYPDREEYGTRQYIKENPKTRAGVRALPLPSDLVAILNEWKKTQAKWRKSGKWAPYPHMSNLVFTTPTGKPLRQQEDGIAWREILAAAFPANDAKSEHIRSLRLYSLRHLAITRMLREGSSVVVVSEIAGHSSVAITHDVYGHLDLADKVSPIENLVAKTLRERNRRTA